ncbi:MAG: S-adenosylmethionine:tRNA ribosyltransferase-isomerase [Chthonomonas sp.]
MAMSDVPVSAFDYDLPEDLIAQEPLPNRSDSRLLVLRKETGQIEHRRFFEVGDLLQPGDLLVVNDTRVTARRLFGHRPTGAKCEVLVLDTPEPRGDEWVARAIVKPAKRLRPGDTILFADDLKACVADAEEGGFRTLRFEGPHVLAALERHGFVPLPPYIARSTRDDARYQTVYARHGGSAAAPTAGLHFTDDILAQLRAKGVAVARVTLDVGLDTFRPFAAERLTDHPMHGERCRIGPETVQAIEQAKGRIIAVGTTSVRTLESFATSRRRVAAGEMVSKLFISPGFEFQVVDGMFTNFHMPRTTMLAMLAAMMGRDRLMAAYEEAVRRRYRFLSFGDGMVII